MKVRLYRGPANCRGYVDEFSLYFPYPKWLREHDGVKGCFVGCSQDSRGGVIRCSWDYLDQRLGYSIEGLGRRYPLEKMSKEFRKWARRLERLFNDALRYNDDKHWERWLLA